jgi:predicted dehydrogenase
MSEKVSRRFFIMASAATMAAVQGMMSKPTVHKSRIVWPNQKLNVAAIGAGGKGASDIGPCEGENIVALADVDWKTAEKTFAKYPNAKKYKDFREMLDKEQIDACTVSTPDHTHSVAAIACMERGIHVYVQKPLTHTIYEARKLREAARKYKVATQMGNQGHSGEGTRRVCEMIWTGAIGNVKEVHAWTNRPIWPQGIDKPLPEQKVPEHIDWNLWVGPAPMRPYNEKYAPFNWRGWYDFGCGALGDMACHILDAANWALKLEAPISVECVNIEKKNDQTYPTKSILKFEFPARGSMPPVVLYWYEGGLKPPQQAGIPADARLGDGDNGSLFVGENGYLTTGCYGDGTRLVPVEKMKEYKMPSKILTRSPGHNEDWLRACKGGESACSNFEYSGPFTEWVLLGTVAQRVAGKLQWDSAKMKFTNNAEANKYIKMPYRKGWKI